MFAHPRGLDPEKHRIAEEEFLALAADASDTHASDTHVGAVLQQQVGQHWQPLGFFSKKLSKSEVNYSTFDRELLAAVSGIKHFRSRLEGCPFQL